MDVHRHSRRRQLLSQAYNMTQFETKPTPLIGNQVAPRHQVKYFCRLCRKYSVRTPKTHLRDYHGGDYRAMQNKAYTDIIKVIFVESL